MVKPGSRWGPLPHSPQERGASDRRWNHGTPSSHRYCTVLACSRHQVRGHAGFRLEAVAALGEDLVRLTTEHSSATSRARADLLLPAGVPSKLAPCGILGRGRSQILEARELMRKLRCVLRLRQS